MKTSEFPTASRLNGPEIVGVVQSETTVQTTTFDISDNVWRRLPWVMIGKDIGAFYGYSSIAIGYHTVAVGSTSSMAIGNDAISTGFLTLGIGTPSYVTGNSMLVGPYTAILYGSIESVAIGMGNYINSNRATVLGYDNEAKSSNMVAIGSKIRFDSPAENSVFIGGGNNFHAIEPYHSVLISGYSAGVYGPFNTVIGSKARAFYTSIAIGYYAGLQHAPYETAGQSSIAIGCKAYSPRGPSVGIGAYSLSVYVGTAVGIGCLSDGESVAIGYSCNAEGTRGVAIGQYTEVSDNAVALGIRSSTNQSYSMALGALVSDPAIGGTFVNAGVPVASPFRPVVFHEKLIGSTISPKPATAAWGDGSYTATVVFDTAGAIGNSYVLAVASNAPDSPLTTTWDGTTLSILLATNDPSTNTLLNISGLFPTNGFAFFYTDGFDATVVSFAFTEDFANGTDGSPTMVLTADGNSPSPGVNLPATYENSLATLTCTVVGVTPDLFGGSSGDAATFTMAPVMVLHNSVDDYSFIGTPTFSLTSNTENAGEWDVPVLSIQVLETQLQLTVNNIDADVNWMAHLTFEASQNNVP